MTAVTCWITSVADDNKCISGAFFSRFMKDSVILWSVSVPTQDELRRLLPELWRVRDGSLWLLLLFGHEPHERDGVPEALPDRRHQHPEDDTERWVDENIALIRKAQSITRDSYLEHSNVHTYFICVQKLHYIWHYVHLMNIPNVCNAQRRIS